MPTRKHPHLFTITSEENRWWCQSLENEMSQRLSRSLSGAWGEKKHGIREIIKAKDELLPSLGTCRFSPELQWARLHDGGLNSQESREKIKLTMHHILHAVDERCITGGQEEQLEPGRPTAGNPSVDFGVPFALLLPPVDHFLFHLNIVGKFLNLQFQSMSINKM